jgi:hypothetical protein
MDSMQAALANVNGKKTQFIVFSNESLRLNPSENVLLSKSPWYVDQTVMSLCDYLIGPPSTFTMWASYLGEAVYYQIKDDSGTIKLNDFVLCRG